MTVREINVGVRILTDLQERPHNDLENRDRSDCHPITSISSLDSQLTTAGIIHTSYYIYNKSGIIYAKNGLTGTVETSNVDFKTVITYTIGQSTSSEKIVIGDGTFTVNTSGIIVDKPNIIIQGLGSGRTIIYASNGLNDDLITVKSSNVYLRDFGIDGNKVNQTSGRGIVVTNATNTIIDSSFDNLKVKYCKSGGIYVNSTILNLRMSNILCELNDGIGFNINGSDHIFNSCESRSNSSHGWQLTGSSHALIACYGSGNLQSGYNAGSFRTEFIGCFADRNTQHGIYLSGDMCAIIGGHYYLNNKANSFYMGIAVVGNNCRVSARVGEAHTVSDPQTHQYNINIQSTANNTILANNELIRAGASVNNLLEQGIGTIVDKNFGYSWSRGLKTASVLFSEDIGNYWKDLGALATNGIFTGTYAGNNTGIFADASGHVIRTTNSGRTWTDIGQISTGGNVRASCNCGGGIILIGDDVGHIHRSLDYGATWPDEIIIVGGITILSLQYLGHGRVLATFINGRVHYSTDYGTTWTLTGISFDAQHLWSSAYIGGNGQAYGGDNGGNLYGINGFGQELFKIDSFTGMSSVPLYAICYLGNQMALIGDDNGHIFKGVNIHTASRWKDVGGVLSTPSSIRMLLNLGNGIVLLGDFNGRIGISTDYGDTWSNVGTISSSVILSSMYLGDGVIAIGDNANHIFLSDVALRTEE